jgi:hypothetical protein
MKREDQINSEIYPPGVPIKCRWLRVRDVLANYPIRTTSLYKLIAERKIKSFLLKDHGAVRGIRLIDRDSLDLFFEMEAAKAEDQNRPTGTLEP